MGKTKIEWADRVWNPVTGCSKVSEGCRHCYAEMMAKRFWGERNFSDVQCHEERLGDPLKWKKPARIFVNSMSDLFHHDVPIGFIAGVWSSMLVADHHTFIVLTKRPKRMLDVVSKLHSDHYFYTNHLPNVWLGVSVEDQVTADERIPLLLQTPAAKRVVSIEPALGPVSLQGWDGKYQRNYLGSEGIKDRTKRGPIDWVIMGGESGPGARPMHKNWAYNVLDQCQEAEVPFFFKQWGAWCRAPFPWLNEEDGDPKGGHTFSDGYQVIRVGKSEAGRLLYGKVWNEVPDGKQ